MIFGRNWTKGGVCKKTFVCDEEIFRTTKTILVRFEFHKLTVCRQTFPKTYYKYCFDKIEAYFFRGNVRDT